MARQRLSAVVMTHPRRREAAEKLALSAPSGLLRVVMDPDPTGTPSVLRTALAAWSAIEDGATHQLVIQDDMLLSESFYDRVRSAIEAQPDAALALFALWDSRNGAAVRMGALAGARWVGAVNEYFPCVAIVLPRRHAEGFAAYGRQRLGGWPDDILMHRYLRDQGVPRYVAVPNLTEHEDRGSISGNAFRGPRRSVCFLPKDPTAQEENRTLTGLTVLPFFKHGVAQCAVRVPGPGPERWLHLDTEQYLEGAGLPESLRRPPGAGGLAEADVRGTWLTAVAMGFEAARTGLAGATRDTEAYAEALATIGPGGISNAHTEEHLARRREALADVARRALDAGHEAAGRRPRPRRRSGLVWRGADNPLGEHLARRLADRHEQADAVIDLTRLASAAPEVTVHPQGAPHPYTLSLGEVYGPGCSRRTPIGRMVWDALRSHPITVEGSPDAEVHAVYVHDLADAIAAVLRTRPDDLAFTVAAEPHTAAELARAVHEAVRPVPIRTAQGEDPGRHTPPDHARPPGWTPVTSRARGLHAFAQWLAYEGILLDPNRP
ncbi:hypothetical protein ACF07V_04510 [Streptomyces sp. NPDC015661]|uniref:hypothetical protein n=1 Tax=Streptomyces sp. NPDC015661 TaxID=3364961 RepID=UPI0036FC1E3B